LKYPDFWNKIDGLPMEYGYDTSREFFYLRVLTENPGYLDIKFSPKSDTDKDHLLISQLLNKINLSDQFENPI